jgi:hypothetical protein
MQKNLWLAVTPDEYEFPIYIEDTVTKLAKRLGVTPSTVTALSQRKTNGKTSGRRIIKLPLDEEDQE